VRIGTKIENVEVTIAMVPGRRLGDEYRSIGDWLERANQIPEALERAMRDKLAKRYGSPMWLVVYLNINEFAIRQAETEATIIAAKQRYSALLGDVYVLWKDKLL